MAAEEFNVLLVGAGEQGWESRGPSMKALADDGVVLAAIADPDERQLAWTSDRLGVERTYPAMDEALAAERFDGVILAVPNRLHEPLTVDALAAGCHVLCEKPIAVDAAGGRRMVEAARAADRVLVIGYPYPWMHPGVADLADAGELDSVFRVEGHWIRADGIPPNAAFWDHATAGAAGDLLGHVLSVVRVGIRSRPASVTAFMWSHFGRASHGDAFAGHDTLEALVAFEGGETAHLVVAWAANQANRESIGVTFHGSEASLEVPLMGRELDVESFRPTIYRRGEDPRTLDGLPVQTEDTFVLQGRNWVEAARGNEPVRFPAEDALDVQAVLDAAIASASQHGRPVEPQL